MKWPINDGEQGVRIRIRPPKGKGFMISGGINSETITSETLTRFYVLNANKETAH